MGWSKYPSLPVQRTVWVITRLLVHVSLPKETLLQTHTATSFTSPRGRGGRSFCVRLLVRSETSQCPRTEEENPPSTVLSSVSMIFTTFKEITITSSLFSLFPSSGRRRRRGVWSLF